MSSSIKIQAYRCVWDGRWMQYHDHTDPLPDKWDDEPPDEVAALVLKVDADYEIAEQVKEIERLQKHTAELEALLPQQTKTIDAIHHVNQARGYTD